MQAISSRTKAFAQDHSGTLQLFLFLQVMDFLTTILGFKLGCSEASPFIRWLGSLGPEAGVLISKLIACALVGYCVWRRRFHLVAWINYWYSALVIWNMVILLVAARR